MTNSEQFWVWVNRELAARDLNYHRLERLAGLANAAVSKPARLALAPSPAVCLGIARVLGAPPEAVFRRAGLLPPVPPAVADEDELVQIFRRLPATLRSAVLLMVRALRPLQLPFPPNREAEARRAARADDDLIGEQLVEEFRSLPPELQRVALDELEQAQRLAGARLNIIGLEEDQPPMDQTPRQADDQG